MVIQYLKKRVPPIIERMGIGESELRVSDPPFIFSSFSVQVLPSR